MNTLLRTSGTGEVALSAAIRAAISPFCVMEDGPDEDEWEYCFKQALTHYLLPIVGGCDATTILSVLWRPSSFEKVEFRQGEVKFVLREGNGCVMFRHELSPNDESWSALVDLGSEAPEDSDESDECSQAHRRKSILEANPEIHWTLS